MPTQGDRPIEEIAVLCDIQIERGMTVWQKWTCDHCGARQTMDAPNVLYRSGICEECSQQTDIQYCGFMLANATGAELVQKSLDAS